MKKFLITPFILGCFLLFSCDVFSQHDSKHEHHASDTVIHANTIVPVNHVFYVKDTTGKKSVLTENQLTKVALDCFRVPCPKNFGTGTRCWECRPQVPQPQQ